MVKRLKKLLGGRLTAGQKKNLYILLGRIPILNLVLRSLVRRSSPVYLISFPKCGRTWLRIMMGRVLQLHFNLAESDIISINSNKEKCPGYPGLTFLHDDSAHWRKPGELEKSKRYYKYKRVIFLVRDPKDVMVSMYFEKNRRLPAYVEGEKNEHPEVAERVEPYPGDLSNYLRQEIGGIETILTYYNIWSENRGIPGGFLLLTYEDIHKDPARELRRVVDFTGLKSVSDSTIQAAVSYSSFDNMRQLESKNSGNTVILRPADKNDAESYKTRKGKVGGYTEYLSSDETEYLDSKIKEILAPYYESYLGS